MEIENEIDRERVEGDSRCLIDGENRQILDSLGKVVDNGIGGKAEIGGSDQEVQYGWNHVDERDGWCWLSSDA